MNEDEKWMQLAIQEAIEAEKDDEVPVGAVLVKDNILIAKAHNLNIANIDPSAHAEIEALRKGSSKLKNYRLSNCTLYVTLEPCAMCYGAIMNSRIKRIVFGAYDYKTGVCGSSIDLTKAKCFNHKVIIMGGVLNHQCSVILKKFFKSRRL
jgi:tRNA(adenine34) deaminase